MKLATILPVAYQYLEEDNDYHLALAHLVAQSEDYAAFFRRKSDRGDLVIMDNGVVEGQRRSVPELIAAAEKIGASEVILPDEIGDTEQTLLLGQEALAQMQLTGYTMMAVPQGDLAIQWSYCLYEMLRWPISTIGISKFIYRTTGMTRPEIVARFGQEIIDAGKQIHLLGAIGGADEIRDASPLVRGADTGYPAICAAEGQKVSPDGSRPDQSEIDWLDGSTISKRLMEFNYHSWRRWIGLR